MIPRSKIPNWKCLRQGRDASDKSPGRQIEAQYIAVWLDYDRKMWVEFCGSDFCRTRLSNGNLNELTQRTDAVRSR